MDISTLLKTSILFGLLAGFPFAALFLLLRRTFFMPLLQQKILKDAESVVAELDTNSVRQLFPGFGTAKYEYTVRGKLYRYRTTVNTRTPRKYIVLYYMRGHEEKATVKQSFTGDPHNFIFLHWYAIGVIIGIAVSAVMAILCIHFYLGDVDK